MDEVPANEIAPDQLESYTHYFHIPRDNKTLFNCLLNNYFDKALIAVDSHQQLIWINDLAQDLGRQYGLFESEGRTLHFLSGAFSQLYEECVMMSAQFCVRAAHVYLHDHSFNVECLVCQAESAVDGAVVVMLITEECGYKRPLDTETTYQ